MSKTNFDDEYIVKAVRKCFEFLKKEIPFQQDEEEEKIQQSAFMVSCAKILIEVAMLFKSTNTEIEIESEAGLWVVSIKNEEVE